MLRLAASDARLWAPIAQANATALADALDAVAAGLQATAAGLRAADLEPLLTAFSDAHRAVGELGQLHNSMRKEHEREAPAPPAR
jgi:prephenate dehydrogenase